MEGFRSMRTNEAFQLGTSTMSCTDRPVPPASAYNFGTFA